MKKDIYKYNQMTFWELYGIWEAGNEQDKFLWRVIRDKYPIETYKYIIKRVDLFWKTW